MCVWCCVCVCVHACVHACMCVCVCKVSSAQGFVICSEYIGTMLQAQYFPRKQNERLNTRVHTHIHTLHTNWPWHRCLETRVHRDTTFAVCLQTNTVQTQFLCVWPSANTHQQDITLKLEKYTQVVVVLFCFLILFMQWSMRMRVITDDTMKVHFSLRLLDRATDHAYCHKYPGVNQVRELRHLQCWSSN